MAVQVVYESNGTMKAILEGEIDHHTAKEIRETIDYNINVKSPSMLEIDFSKIQFMDSSGIGLIMGRYKLMKSINGQIKVINVPDSILRMIKLSGLTALGIIEL